MTAKSKEGTKRTTLNMKQSIYDKLEERSILVDQTITQVVNNILRDTLTAYGEENIENAYI